MGLPLGEEEALVREVQSVRSVRLDPLGHRCRDLFPWGREYRSLVLPFGIIEYVCISLYVYCTVYSIYCMLLIYVK